MYTRKIAFATLGSQCAAPSAGGRLGCSQGEINPSQGPERLRASRSNAVVVEPCSPKSIDNLANEVCLTLLRSGAVTNSRFIWVGLIKIYHAAFKKIQSNLNERNIVQELFSPFTVK